MAETDIEKIQPREDSGSCTQSRYGFQREFIVFGCIEMLHDSSNIVKVYCDFHDDCVYLFKDGFYRFHQIKGQRGNFTPSKLRQALPGMFHNYDMVGGNCETYLVTNAQMDSQLNKFFTAREHLKDGIADNEEKKLVKENKTRLSKHIAKKIGKKNELIDSFLMDFKVIEEFPSFSTNPKEIKASLKDFNVNRLAAVLSDSIQEAFPLEDVEILYDDILGLVEEKSKLPTRANRFVTSEMIWDHLDVPESQKSLFSTDFTEEEVENLKNQSILQRKLESGGFTEEFIKRAKFTRYATKYFREKRSKYNSQRKLINDFEFRLQNVCVEIFEHYSRQKHFDSLAMLKDLKKGLIGLAKEEKYKKLDLNPDFVKGLIFEATSSCVFRWGHD